ncbi:MAG: YecA family protein [Pseudomonadales bacterium]|nr:YecA family protein [Pseudomonadales bacterium]
MENNALTKDEVAEIEDFLQSEELSDAHDYFGTHGFICGLAVSPVGVGDDNWLAILLDVDEKTLSNPTIEANCKQLVKLKKSIDYSFYHNEKLFLPCPLKLSTEPDESPLRSWAIGFMETVFLDEESWYEVDEETVAQLLLPIILASGLHEDPDIKKYEQDPKLGKAILSQIPEVIIDLYILYRSGSIPDQ